MNCCTPSFLDEIYTLWYTVLYYIRTDWGSMSGAEEP
jgi:hypothetical protein